ncbi:hypothetical protein VP1G_08041 [Cytospora mali]|uniref:Uncharacterized protein n=1 Tax=Cytospora mali TaxID=578113 RepID=A0A194VAL1_CYTMA|nr:hypothetical protein VP1G_08041 [Valsa mali var. pyri (nom. inval.)]
MSNHPTPATRHGGASNESSPLLSGSPDTQSDVFEPSTMDVVVAKAMLSEGLKLPHEIALSILDFAEYWPHTSTVLDHPITVHSGRGREDHFVMRSKPLGLIKKIHYDDHYYSFTTSQPLPHPEDGQYPLSQYQQWIGGPTDTLEHPCRKIVFTIRSRDQGWGGSPPDRGTYRGSWTWFEAGLERFDRNATHPKDTPEKDAAADESAANEAGESSTLLSEEVLPDPYFPVYGMRSVYPTIDPDRPAFHHDLHPSHDWTIQKNKAATRQPTTHKIVWSWRDDVNPLTAEQLEGLGRGTATGNGDFVRNLKLGDVVTVWAKARFAGWINYVERVDMDIYWAL